MFISCWTPQRRGSEAGRDLHFVPCAKMVNCSTPMLNSSESQGWKGVCDGCHTEYRVIITKGHDPSTAIAKESTDGQGK
jgi:hypothetical protein